MPNELNHGLCSPLLPWRHLYVNFLAIFMGNLLLTPWLCWLCTSSVRQNVQVTILSCNNRQRAWFRCGICQGFFFFLLLNNNIIQLAKELAISHTSISNFYRETTLIETERPKLDCILCSLMCSSIETSNPIKLQFKKKLRSSSILLTVVAMDQSDWISAMVRGSKQDFASPSMMICSQFSVRASWIEQSTAAASARSGEHNLCMLAQSVSPSFALHN